MYIKGKNAFQSQTKTWNGEEAEVSTSTSITASSLSALVLLLRIKGNEKQSLKNKYSLLTIVVRRSPREGSLKGTIY